MVFIGVHKTIMHVTFASSHQLDSKEPEKEVYIVPVLPHCHSDHKVIFLSCLMASKALLLLFGVFLAWKTRNVKIDILNDSKNFNCLICFVLLQLLLLLFLLLLFFQNVRIT